MYGTTILKDMHERTHRSLARLIEHCETLSAEEIDRELAGFGYATVHLQLEHMVGAEEYWLHVIKGSFREEDVDGPGYPSVAAIEQYRRQVAGETEEYLDQASVEELNTAREMSTWPNKRRSLVPARIIVRTMTHIYQHQGQVLAMCRLLGRPGPAGLDFPIVD